MKKAFFIFSILCFSLNSSAQKLLLTISGKSESENAIIDSLGYNKNHINAKSIVDEINLMSNTLTQIGYIENEILDRKKVNDSSFSFQFDLGAKTEYIYIGRNATLNSLFNTNQETLIIPYKEIEFYLKQTLSSLEKKGYALAKLKLINLKKIRNRLYADLQVNLGQQRQLDGIVIRGYDKFPKGHIQNIRRIYKNQTFNQDNLKKIHADFEKFRFVKQVKYPEILFEKDSTLIYVYLEKAKSNNFEGFIGFSNDKGNKIALNGYLDLNLNNALNSGESFSLVWKGENNQQRTFNAAIAIPYVFKSPFGIKAQLIIFKQDSTFQNAKKAIDVGYFFNYNTRIYLGYQSTESSDIQNQNNKNISDYSNKFITSNFEFVDYKDEDVLFPEKTKINIAIGTGSRNSKFNTNHQLFINIDLKHNLYLNAKNSVNIKSQNFYLQSNKYITNELYRFGGINSIRGYTENSLQSNLFTSLLTEYRYAFTNSLYIHSITDYGYYQDKSTNNKGNLLGLGIGFGVLTKNGLLNMIYANGSTKDGGIKNSNSIVQISFKTNF